MLTKLSFDKWIENRYVKIPGRERYSDEEKDEISVDKVVNEYLEYYNTKEHGPNEVWDENDINEEEITKIIFSIDEEILSELDTGEAPHAMVVGNLLNHNICEFYSSTVIPTSSDKDIHPTLNIILIEWLDVYEDFINWKDTSEEDFWSCFNK